MLCPQTVDAWKDLTSGIIGGFALVMAGHPLDTVRMRDSYRVAQLLVLVIAAFAVIPSPKNAL